MMDIAASYVFEAPAAVVWDLLMDPAAIAACLPGCRGLKPIGEDRYEAELTVGIAAITGTFKGTVALRSKVPPDSYELLVEGAGGPGFVKGQARVTLHPDAGRTAVHIAATAQVGGTIARVGQRLLEGVARMLMNRFYDCLARRVAEHAWNG